jgi:hypothetical protein
MSWSLLLKVTLAEKQNRFHFTEKEPRLREVKKVPAVTQRCEWHSWYSTPGLPGFFQNTGPGICLILDDVGYLGHFLGEQMPVVTIKILWLKESGGRGSETTNNVIWQEDNASLRTQGQMGSSPLESATCGERPPG